MGRSPCCEKVGLKKGPWTPEEDQKLLAYIEEHGHGSWRALPTKAGLQRCGKSCRLRWTNYLRPDIKRGKFSLQEEQTIIQLHALLGNRWSAIATHLPKRTDNEIKNYWNTHLKKRLAKMGIDPVTHKPKSDALTSPADGHSSKSAANLSHMAQWESARLEAEARLVRESKFRSSSTSSSSASTTASFQSHPPLLGSSAAPVPIELHNTSASPAPPPQPPCLDVLRAWQGVWSKSTRGGQSSHGGKIDLESPTSTLSSFSENVLPLTVLGFGDHNNNSAVGQQGGGGEEEEEEEEEEEVDWKCFGKPMRLFDTREKMENLSTFSMDSPVFGADAPWFHEYLKIGTGGHFGDGFTDMLLQNSGDRNSSDCGCTDSVNAGGGGGDDDGGNVEENKDYWDSILNLVNSSSPSNSPPVF